MAKRYPMYDGNMVMTGHTRWPNPQGHPPVEEDGAEIAAYNTSVETKQTVAVSFNSALLTELEVLLPGITERVDP